MSGLQEGALSLLPSTYADDEVIAEILPQFLKNIPKYTGDLESYVEHGEWASAARICHDLKGTAGGYGYPTIAQATQLLEEELKGAHDPTLVRMHLNDVQGLCERARLALPPT